MDHLDIPVRKHKTTVYDPSSLMRYPEFWRGAAKSRAEGRSLGHNIINEAEERSKNPIPERSVFMPDITMIRRNDDQERAIADLQQATMMGYDITLHESYHKWLAQSTQPKSDDTYL